MDVQDLEENEDQDQVMSDVHLGCPPGSYGLHISHFTISIPPGVDCRIFKDEQSPHPRMVGVDEDGDLILTRRHACMPTLSFSITIQHKITSTIPNVGLQVWKAELVLADFVLHKMFTSSDFDGIISLEFGAGTGLVGLLLTYAAKVVFITDRGDEILDNCASNVDLNSKVLNYQGTIHVHELDWMDSWPPSICLGNSACYKRYHWTSLEVEEAQRASLLVAADVIYSDDLTDALFCILGKLMSLGQEKVLYLALEKRYNFSLDDLDVVANGYSHFRSHLRKEEEHDGLKYSSSSCFVGKCLDLSLIPQYVGEYERGNDVELWQITYSARELKSGDCSY